MQKTIIKINLIKKLLILLSILLAIVSCKEQDRKTNEPFSISGIYPHLATYNSQGEFGTGAVMPWADRLWVITYSPHWPKGSDDKLYEIPSSLELEIREESVGGTPANRMIHKESNQLGLG